MTPEEMERKIVTISCAANSLTAAIAMTNEHFFDVSLERIGEDYWIAPHDQISGVMGALLTLSTGIRDDLAGLAQVKIEISEEGQG